MLACFARPRAFAATEFGNAQMTVPEFVPPLRVVAKTLLFRRSAPTTRMMIVTGWWMKTASASMIRIPCPIPRLCADRAMLDSANLVLALVNPMVCTDHARAMLIPKLRFATVWTMIVMVLCRPMRLTKTMTAL